MSVISFEEAVKAYSDTVYRISLNILKNAGVDLNTPQPVTVTLQKFAEKLAELKKLLGK